jgi:hypothetical protein
MILRTGNPAGGAMMTTLIDRSTVQCDQPYVSATSEPNASAVMRDRVFIGVNFYEQRKGNSGTGKTAQVMASNDASSAAPSGFSNLNIEYRDTHEQDMPAIRTSIHSSGVVYAIFYRWTAGNSSPYTCDVVVARDDNWGTGSNPFDDLTDSGDGIAGQRVVTGRTVPAFTGSAYLGGNRLVASNLSIAVDPSNSANVWAAWCDRVGTSDYTIHLRRSTNSGQAWGADILTVTNATNPALAISSAGKVGFMYQQLTGTSPNQVWNTHFRLAAAGSTTFSDDVVATFLNSLLSSSTISPELGDYLDMEAVGSSFYAVFPSGNVPDAANFPKGATYQRNANFTTHNLLGTDGVTAVNASVDPFFLKVSPNRFFDLCRLHPEICRIRYIDPGRFRLVCRLTPCIQIISIRDICTRVLDCPGCSGGSRLCPGFYHLYLDGVDPEIYSIDLLDARDEEVKFEMMRTKTGVIVSFRPNKSDLGEKQVPDYQLVFENSKPGAAKESEVKVKLEVSNYPLQTMVKKGLISRR